MKINISLALLLILTLTTGCKKNETTSSITENAIYKKDYKELLDTLVPKLLVKYKCPSAGIGIIENGTIEFIRVFGENQKGHKANSNTIFNVASITKPVVAATVLKFVENGNWDLDEPYIIILLMLMYRMIVYPNYLLLDIV